MSSRLEKPTFGPPTSRVSAENGRTHAPGFAVDEPGNDDEDDDDDELALAALDSLDAIEVYKADQHTETKTSRSQIPIDNFRQLLLFMLCIASLEPQENLSAHTSRITEKRIEGLKRIADSILWSFSPEESPGITFTKFNLILSTSLPYLFDGMNPLFEHFLFSKNLDLSRHTSSSVLPPLPTPAAEPLLLSEGDILDHNTLNQLSFFIKSTNLFRLLRLLYSGNDAGFSINSISQKVLNWRAPSILLVSGTRISNTSTNNHEKSFGDSLPSKRLPSGSSGNNKSGRVVFGAYLNIPWKQTHKEAIGDDQTLLFQLEPLHEVFHASTINRDYATFGKMGIGFGCPAPKKAVSGLDSHVALGPVSLYLDENLEFGVFTHEISGGGAFGTSKTRKEDWQDRFEVEALEVWGCGGDEEAAKQREAWKWEEREAAARRGVKLGRDRDADYALLEMAGLVGGHGNSGGSMG